MILDRSKEVEPVSGEIYKAKGSYNSEYKILKDLGEGTFEIRNVKSGWTVNAHHLTCFDNGTIEWAFSTDGRFEPTEKM